MVTRVQVQDIIDTGDTVCVAAKVHLFFIDVLN